MTSSEICVFATDRRSLVSALAAVLAGGMSGAVAASLLGRANVQVPTTWAATLGATVVLVLALRLLTRTLDVPRAIARRDSRSLRSPTRC